MGRGEVQRAKRRKGRLWQLAVPRPAHVNPVGGEGLGVGTSRPVHSCPTGWSRHRGSSLKRSPLPHRAALWGHRRTRGGRGGHPGSRAAQAETAVLRQERGDPALGLCRQVQARGLPIGCGGGGSLPPPRARWAPSPAAALAGSAEARARLVRVEAARLRPAPAPSLSPRRRRALGSSGSGRAGTSSGARDRTVVLPPATPARVRSRSLGRESAGAGSWSRAPPAPPLPPPPRLPSRSLAQRRQQRSRTDAG